MRWDRFIGLPWAEKGRTPEGVDCWGLVRLVLNERGAPLPSYVDDYVGVEDRRALDHLFASGREAWHPIASGCEGPFDLVLLRQHPWHVGLVVGAGRMLHIPQNATSLIESYTAPRHAHRIDGFFRHEALA